MQNSRTSPRRRRLLINPRLQLTMMGHSILVGLICIVSVHLSYLKNSIADYYIPGIGRVSTEDLSYLPFLALILAFAWGFYFSNRVAGPIYSIQRQLQQNLRDQSFTEVRCRKKDYFFELVKVINASFNASFKRASSDGKK